MSALAIDSTGFLGIILTSTSIKVGACLISGCSRCAHIQTYAWMDEHGGTKPEKDCDGGSSHVHNKGLYANAAQLLQIPQAGHPVTREDKITGTIIILITN